MLQDILETDAAGQTAETYARIRSVLGVPVVNLVWRHLATIDGALAWAWPIVEAAAPAIDQAAPQIVAEADRALAAADLAPVHPGIELPEGAIRVVATYNRGNSWNMLSMTLLAAARAGAAARRTLPPVHAGCKADEPQAVPLPPFPAYDRLAPGLRESIDRLAAAGPAAPSGVRPSLWIHLAVWPDVLGAVAEAYAPVLASPGFARAYADVFGRGAAILEVDAPDPAREGPTGELAIDRAIRIFRLRIAEMLLIGHVLGRTAGPGWPP